MNAADYCTALKACSSSQQVSRLRLICNHLVQRALDFVPCIVEHLVLAFSLCGALDDAYHVLVFSPHRTVFSWTVVVSGYVDHRRVEEAFQIYCRMREDGVHPNEYTFSSLLKACSSIRGITETAKMHGDAVFQGFTSNVFVGCNLVTSYGKCGCIIEAECVFNELANRNTVTWNALLTAYIENRKGQEALMLFRQMLDEHVDLNPQTFIVIIQICCALLEKEKPCLDMQLPFLEIGIALHAEAYRKRFVFDASVGTSLVNMYGKCHDSVVNAEHVFIDLIQRNSVSWNVMLSAYVEQGQPEKALILYRQMQQEGVHTSEHTYVIALQACNGLAEKENKSGNPFKAMSLEIAQALHADAWRKQSDFDVCIASMLLNVYGKCGRIREAEVVFDDLFEHDVVTWSTMISVYVEQNLTEKALQLYNQMLLEGVSSNEKTLVSILQACRDFGERDDFVEDEEKLSELTCLDIGRALHSDVEKNGLHLNVFVGSTLVSMYGKCGCLAEAEAVFRGLYERIIVTWNALLSTYVMHGFWEKALQLYRQMQEEKVGFDSQTCTSTIQACSICMTCEGAVLDNEQSSKTAAFVVGQALHAVGDRLGLTSDGFVGSTLISMYGKFGDTTAAEDAFDAILEPSVVVWSTMLSSYVEQGQTKKFLLLYKQMLAEGVNSNAVTSVLALTVISALMDTNEDDEHSHMNKTICVDIGQALHVDAERGGLTMDCFVSNALISMYGKFGIIEKTESIFHSMSKRNMVSWNALLSVYIEQGEGEKALLFFKKMYQAHVKVDDVTIMCVLQACAYMGSIEICRQLHFIITFAGYDSNLLVASILIRAYGSSASMSDAMTLLVHFSQPCLSSWTSCLSGFSQEGDYNTGLKLFQEMIQADVVPDCAAFHSMLSCCNHCGLIDKSIELFEFMCREDVVIPDLDSYSVMVDLLARAGEFRSVESILLGRAVSDLGIWLSLLSACRTHGHVQLATQIFRCAVSASAEDGAAYILLSNVYADARLLDVADIIHQLSHDLALL